MLWDLEGMDKTCTHVLGLSVWLGSELIFYRGLSFFFFIVFYYDNRFLSVSVYRY